jgi:hypothetical protein
MREEQKKMPVQEPIITIPKKEIQINQEVNIIVL